MEPGNAENVGSSNTRAEEHNITRCHAQDFTTLPSRRWSSSLLLHLLLLLRILLPPYLASLRRARPLTACSSLSKRGSPFRLRPADNRVPAISFLRQICNSSLPARNGVVFPNGIPPSKEAGLSRFRDCYAEGMGVRGRGWWFGVLMRRVFGFLEMRMGFGRRQWWGTDKESNWDRFFWIFLGKNVKNLSWRGKEKVRWE